MNRLIQYYKEVSDILERHRTNNLGSDDAIKEIIDLNDEYKDLDYKLDPYKVVDDANSGKYDEEMSYTYPEEDSSYEEYEEEEDSSYDEDDDTN